MKVHPKITHQTGPSDVIVENWNFWKYSKSVISERQREQSIWNIGYRVLKENLSCAVWFMSWVRVLRVSCSSWSSQTLSNILPSCTLTLGSTRLVQLYPQHFSQLHSDGPNHDGKTRTLLCVINLTSALATTAAPPGSQPASCPHTVLSLL